MAEKKKGLWLNLETAIIGAFFLFFIIWAVQKCNHTAKVKQAEMEQRGKSPQTIRDTATVVQPRIVAPAPISVTPPSQTTVQSIATQQPNANIVAPKPQAIPEKKVATSPSLYVTIDGLNVREKPNIKAKSFGKLSLYDKVSFLGDVTKTTEELSIGTENTNEPWVKIKTKKGTVGWVYGAGVSYYKTKRKGTLE